MTWTFHRQRSGQLYSRHSGRSSLWRGLALALGLVSVSVLLLAMLVGCAPRRQVVIRLGQASRTVHTDARTVREVLAEQNIEVGKLDRVEPDLWEDLRPNMVIVVARVDEKTTLERIEIPFERRTVRNRALPEGESRLIQPGQNGVDEVVYRVTLEDGVEVSRKEVQRRSVRQAVDEILMVGSIGQLPAVPITGTVAYVSSGNAWIMRHSSESRRPLTSSGDLDLRVFSLSPDGSQLIFSRGVAEGPPTPLNALWVITTTVVGEKPVSLGVDGAIYAQWMPDGKSFVYSTADRISGAPGWKAHNDLRIFSTAVMTTVRSFSAPSDDLYNWWGNSFAVSPDGRNIAYGSAQQVGIINSRTGQRQSLMRFPVYHTYSEWIWVSSLSWSPDGQYVAATVHGQEPTGIPEDSPLFDLWVLGADGKISVKLAPQVGMWGMPAWSPETASGSQIVYGQARDPLNSQNCLYDLHLVDRDGSNGHALFPPTANGVRVPTVAWSPQGDSLLYVENGDIYLLDINTGRVHPLTDDGYSGAPRWTR